MKNKKLFAILTLLCFMFTLMPVAAFAATIVPGVADSYVMTVDTNKSFVAEKTAKITFDLDKDLATTGGLVFWVTEGSSTVPSTALTTVKAGNVEYKDDAVAGMYLINSGLATGAEYTISIDKAGTYTVHAATPDVLNVIAGADTVAAGITKSADYMLQNNIANQNQFVVKAATTQSVDYQVAVINDADGLLTENAKTTENGYITAGWGDGATIGKLALKATDVSSEKITLKLFNKDGKVLSGQSVAIDSNSASVTVTPNTAKTNALGQFDFYVSGATEGNYEVYVTVGNYEAVIDVQIGATAAALITTTEEPTAPIALGEETGDYITFELTDINGNGVKGDIADKAYTDANSKYATFVSKPAGSDLNYTNLVLTEREKKSGEYTVNFTPDVEGTYTVKVTLDNGKSATATFEVKEFGTPVKLNLEYKQESVELAGTAKIGTLEYVDANGVVKSLINNGTVKNATLAASGYAIDSFNAKTGDITVKSDEKYVGATIKVTAVSERYNLVASTEITVADEAASLAFDTKTLDVNTNNKVGVQIVDASGNKVAPTNVVSSDISYVVLDKPADAKVSVTTSSYKNLADKGEFTMAVTSSKVGNVTIQAIAKLSIKNAAKNDDVVVKYYTGTQIFAVGTEGTGDVVVMSIGSNEIIVNDAKATIDAAPIIENNRTFVPFRALAEAFGATVAYDEATQAVTAELNGTTVVMTIGSATYTVNGVEKTADVAPFINGSRTMVPVRFAAEAFGIKVIPTYDENGATADILFNL